MKSDDFQLVAMFAHFLFMFNIGQDMMLGNHQCWSGKLLYQSIFGGLMLELGNMISIMVLWAVPDHFLCLPLPQEGGIHRQ